MNLLDIYTREELFAWYLENHDKVSDFWLCVNRAREPYPGVVGYVDALKADPVVWNNFNSFPGAYRRIKVDRIQHYNNSKRLEYAMHSGAY